MTRVAVSMLRWKKLGLEQRLGGRIVTYAGDLDAETGHAASARRTRFAILRTAFTFDKGSVICTSSQNWAWFPKYRPSLTAASAVIDRRPFSMSVMRADGTVRRERVRADLR
jgi:hypothetical protein